MLTFNRAGTISATGPVVNLGSMPIVVSLPTSSNITGFRVAQNGKILKQASISGQLLEGLISSIPDNAFKPTGRDDHDHDKDDRRRLNFKTRDRALLDDKVTKIQMLLASKKPREATEALRDLIQEVERLTYRNYAISDASQLTQSEVINEIQKIIKSIEVPSGRHERDHDR